MFREVYFSFIIKFYRLSEIKVVLELFQFYYETYRKCSITAFSIEAISKLFEARVIWRGFVQEEPALSQGYLFSLENALIPDLWLWFWYVFFIWATSKKRNK